MCFGWRKSIISCGCAVLRLAFRTGNMCETQCVLVGLRSSYRVLVRAMSKLAQIARTYTARSGTNDCLETRLLGNTIAWKHDCLQTRLLGNTIAWKHDCLETRLLGNMIACKHDCLETRLLGYYRLETRLLGNTIAWKRDCLETRLLGNAIRFAEILATFCAHTANATVKAVGLCQICRII